MIHGRVERLLLARRATRSKLLVLTFDDGPGDGLTSAILALLAASDVKATFFLLGRNIVGREEIVRRIAGDGHEICSHGYDHLHYWKVSPLRVVRDIKQGWRAIDAALGRQGGRYVFRPPYGKLTLIGLLYLLILRVPVAYWTADSTDTWPLDRRDSRRLADILRRTGGAVTLSHDFERSDPSVSKNVVDSLRLVLNTAKEQEVRTATISELLALRER
jgi:peptidoglycan/xylan/chitin deacetylase (PgdA/CDA1 family)